MYDDDLPYEYQKPPRSPVAAAVLASVLTTVVVFAGLRLLEQQGMLSWLSRPALRTAAEVVEVPALLGLRVEQARELLKGRGLLLTIASEEAHSGVPAGGVVSQVPLAGSQLARESAVSVVLSRGAGQVAIPDLAGSPKEKAVRSLVAAGLVAGPEKAVASPTAAAGSVIATEPAEGTTVASGSAVTLVVSSGVATKAVPKVTGLGLSRARRALTQQGFTLGKVRRISDSEEMSGVIIEQTPPAESAATPGTAVDVVINVE